ncbi:MAG: V-type ATPase 116kDa subunit family protein [Lachnospiraceae bacterium]|nr:V-type ATPase 116kDa subunit family protein [Lachnospiraceae bacterium]
MIEKMKFLNLTGPKEQFDRVTEDYLSRYEIHLENALSQLQTVKDLRPFVEANPYRSEYKKAEELMKSFEGQEISAKELTLEESAELVHTLEKTLADKNSQKEALQKELETLTASRDQVVPFTGLNYDVSSILHFKCIKFRFGRIAREYFDKFDAFVYDAIDTVMFKCQEDDEYVWVVYFVPAPVAEKVDAIYASMHFERRFLPDEYEGTPGQAAHELDEKIQTAKAAITALDAETKAALESQKEALAGAYQKLDRYTRNFDVRRLAACTNNKEHPFFILCGWMAEDDADRLQKELQNDKDLFLIVEKDHDNVLSKPPTKMKNPKLFKPFEMFIQMYGLPDYNEIDPTILIGITYSFLFGFMFGDVGQGLFLLIGGFLLYRAKKMNLAAIISCCGFFSTIFGFLFGSVFGFEDVIDAVWLHPGQAMINLPFIGKLNLVFAVTVALGMGIIMMTMVLNIINSLRVHDTEKAWFDTNGAAGLVFYFALASVVILFMSGNALPATVILVVMFGIPLLLMFFKEPLTRLVEKKSASIEGGAGMFVVQGFFELFEVLLSYFSNTLSFVRVGAFAVSHAAMMEVVLMLAGYETGNTNWIVVVLGNLFVCGMEGLIVGIQVLRLEYYELFSRFYRGTGRAFVPYGKTAKND